MDIGVFLPTGTRGYLISATAPLNDPTYALNLAVVQTAERYGFEFALSMVKFRGFGGDSQYWDGALEPFTLIAALAAVTTRIRLFCTAASLAMPPAIVARMAATMDQIAPGRIGINLITGWQKAEYEQMGLWPGEVHFERRYDLLTEYVQVLRDLWDHGRSDLQGEFYTMTDCRLLPRPANPIGLVVAASSDRGMDFAVQHCDYNFCGTSDALNQPEVCAATVDRLHAAAARHGKSIAALVWVSVIAAETDAAAFAKWEHYKQGTDLVALGWRKQQAAADQTSTDPNSIAMRNQAKVPLPAGGFKLIGSYATIARLLDEMSCIPGLSGVMLSFDDFLLGMEQFGQHIQPLMACRQC